MNFSVTNVRMAHALSIIAEKSPSYFQYSSHEYLLTDSLISQKGRWTILPSPSFSRPEFHFFLTHAARENLIDVKDDYGIKLAAGHIELFPYEIRLTFLGWKFIEDNDITWLQFAAIKMRNNLPNVITFIP